MQHVEFVHRDHFAYDYFRKKPKASLSHFIDFFWETDFDHLYERYPSGFSDALFPNTGYTYLINLGTPFTMKVGEKSFPLKTDAFLPRHLDIECFHSAGNKLFGIKFRLSPVLFEKKVDFSEYKEYIFPLSYLIDRQVVAEMKAAVDFKSRMKIVSDYYDKVLETYSGSGKPFKIVAEILDECYNTNSFDVSIEFYAAKYDVSTRSLQRYFEAATSLSSKKALQIMRIRKAVTHLVEDPATFSHETYGYYDHSHFSKHLKQFLGKHEALVLKHLHQKQTSP
jgi:AraC-like DNA-binding protein